jgi:hypothetical protein
VWAAAEEKLAEQAPSYRPSELAVFALDLITALDQDGPGEREDEPAQVKDLHVSARTGKVKGQLDGLTRRAGPARRHWTSGRSCIRRICGYWPATRGWYRS